MENRNKNAPLQFMKCIEGFGEGFAEAVAQWYFDQLPNCLISIFDKFVQLISKILLRLAICIEENE